MTVGVNRADAALDYRDTLYRDTLEKAADPPGDINVAAGEFFDVFAADQESYDNNVYRLPDSADVAEVVGPNAARHDHINTASAGLDGQWTAGRQLISLGLRADDNRYADNTDLNNTSGYGRLILNWTLGSALSGLVGADYTRYLASFVNSNFYGRNMVDATEYYGGARYQVGPRWAIFGGVLQSDTSLTAVPEQPNNNNKTSSEIGVEYSTDTQNRMGLEYRYTDTSFPNTTASAGTTFYPNYTEDRTRLFLKYAISDKTLIDASAGYLKRDYTTHAVGSFSGDIWRASLQWQPREKTQLTAVGWRELHAYLTAESDYYVSDGVSVSPVWLASEKFDVSLLASYEKQDYTGAPAPAPGAGTRHDEITAEQASVMYTAARNLILNFSVRHELRSSTAGQYAYNDTLAAIGVTGKF